MSINKQISDNLKINRKLQQMTLVELSDVSGVSKTMLSEIERGNANPSITVLCKIAEALKIPLTSLIEERSSMLSVVRSNQRKLISGHDKYRVESVFPFSGAIEVFNLDIKVGGSIKNDGHRSGVIEYIIMVSGKIKVVIGDETLIIESGDCVKFDADVRHELSNSGNTSAVIINIHEYKN